MLFDFYEMTMSNGYFQTGLAERHLLISTSFSAPCPTGAASPSPRGWSRWWDYIRNLRFDEEDIDYLRGKGLKDEAFLDYLRRFRFTGDIWAVPEGRRCSPASRS